jgi:hypothetical protein
MMQPGFFCFVETRNITCAVGLQHGRRQVHVAMAVVGNGGMNTTYRQPFSFSTRR